MNSLIYVSLICYIAVSNYANEIVSCINIDLHYSMICIEIYIYM